MGNTKRIADQKPARSARLTDPDIYSRFVDLSGEAMYVLVNRHFVFVNARFEELSGYAAEELLASGFDLMDLIAPESRFLIEKRLEQIDRGESPSSRYTFKGKGKGREASLSSEFPLPRNNRQRGEITVLYAI